MSDFETHESGTMRKLTETEIALEGAKELLRKAADEIERLTTAVAHLEGDVDRLEDTECSLTAEKNQACKQLLDAVHRENELLAKVDALEAELEILCGVKEAALDVWRKLHHTEDLDALGDALEAAATEQEGET